MIQFEEIEGQTPLDDISGLKIAWIKTKTHLDVIEANSIRKAINIYLGKKRHTFPKWFTVKNINGVHRKMFGDVWQWAGKYRRTEKSIGVDAYKIQEEMKKLEDDILFWASMKWDPIEISAHVHHRLVWIHPYENGNGRLGRLIGDVLLHAQNYRYPIWPNDIGEHGKKRKDYLHALREADERNFTPLGALLVKYGAKKIKDQL